MRLLVLAALVTAALVSATPAHADDATDNYLHGLDAGSIGYDSPDTALMIGNTVCDSFRRGLSDAKVSAMLMAGAQLDWGQAHTVIANATSYLCPSVPVG
jgi:hypothetical protein